jgi:hypothetical protein
MLVVASRSRGGKVWPFVRRSADDPTELTIPLVNHIFDDAGIPDNDDAAVAMNAFFVAKSGQGNEDDNDDVVNGLKDEGKCCSCEDDGHAPDIPLNAQIKSVKQSRLPKKVCVAEPFELTSV